jgi:hypothetical protein
MMRPCYLCAEFKTEFFVRAVPVCTLCHATHLPNALLESKRPESNITKPEVSRAAEPVEPNMFELDLGLDGLSWDTQKTPTNWPP